MFNETLYYLPDPAAVLTRYEKMLAPGGVIVVSMYRAPTTARVWRRIEVGREALDAVTVTQRSGSAWDVRVDESPV